ncbi:hypothetical protein TNCV_3359711, partial [Trichonephila clavipes]
GDTTYLHLYNLGLEREGRGKILQPLHPWFLLRPPTRLSDPLRAPTPVYSEAFGDIEHRTRRPQSDRSDALTTRLPTDGDRLQSM